MISAYDTYSSFFNDHDLLTLVTLQNLKRVCQETLNVSLQASTRVPFFFSANTVFSLML